MNVRYESDSIGTREIPKDAYWGVQSLRGKENFPISGQVLRKDFIVALAEVKKTCALSNQRAGILSAELSDVICRACDEIIGGDLHDQFLCDPIQGGAGTTANMNANEVIANRAIELLGGVKGDYSLVHPNDHVNCSQSTNDVFPTAARITAYRLLLRCIEVTEELVQVLSEKEKKFHSVIKMGRTQMQDAVPIRLGDEFGAYACAAARSRERLAACCKSLRQVHLGGTAIGTALNANREYLAFLPETLREVTALPLETNANFVDGTQNTDDFVFLSSALKTAATALSKIANDLRLMSSGPRCGLGEIRLPPMQNGSSIMPGKVNPVIPEVMSQAAFCIIGNDLTVTMASEAGQLELNFAEPIMIHKVFESLTVYAGAVKTFTERCLRGLEADEEKCRKWVEESVGVITALCPVIGYQASAKIAKEAIATGLPIRKVLLSKGLFSEEKVEELLNPENLV